MRHPSALSAASAETFDPPPLPLGSVCLGGDAMFRRAHTLVILRSALRLLDRGTDPAARTGARGDT